MRYAQIRKTDISNGIGFGVSMFLQGCSHHCKGCFNSETWNFDGGYEFTPEIEEEFLKSCMREHVDFISFLGGEPFDQADELYNLIKLLRRMTSKPIYIWSGYTYEQILSDPNKAKILTYINYLIEDYIKRNSWTKLI